jgi:acyl CoA:acetate/3-ketoacid CoA transferase alpha subunit
MRKEHGVHNKWQNFFDKTFNLDKQEGINKVLCLSDAVKHNIRPGMTLYIGERANAFTAELIRQYYGTQPHFTLVMLVVIEQALNLIHAGLAKKIIAASCTEFFPTTGPSPIIRNAFKQNALEIENWSLCSLNQRLLAGALGVPVMPTNSIVGSTMAEENKDSFAQIANPFEEGNKVNVVKALKPDVALIHGWAADPEGNTILAPFASSGEHSNGAKASKGGVLVSVENIVSTQFIREHSALVSIPGGIVNSISLAPFGAHPQAMIGNYGVKEFQCYVDDYEFTRERRLASAKAQEMEDWVKLWVLGCATHEDYLKKLGSKRTSALIEKAGKLNWSDNLDIASLSYRPEYNSREMMVVAAARKTKELVLQKGYDGILSGLGTSGLPGWIAYHDLKRGNYSVNLWLGSGVYGFSPCPGDPQLFSLPTVLSGKMLTDGLNSYGVFICGNHRKKNMSILSAAQVDREGNLNSTRTSDTHFLIGSGGGNDAANANEVLVVIPLSPSRFVRKVPYITCPGHNVTVIVSDMGIMERIGGEFTLTTYFPDPNIHDSGKIVNKIRESCGWDLKISPQLVKAPPPSLEELVMLRAFDPKGYFINSD